MRSPAPTAFRDHYAILGVDVNATEAEIKAAYRERAKECHPDLHPGDVAAAERFRQISEARRVLLSPASRSAFNLDRIEMQIVSVMQFRRPRSQPAPASPARPAAPRTGVERPAWQGGALILAGIVTVLFALTIPPFVSLGGGPEPVNVSGFDGGALAGVLNSGACSILIVLGWATWIGSRNQHRWEALLAFTSLWLLAVTAAEFDPHILVGGFFSSDLALGMGARLLPVGVALTVCGAWLLRPVPVTRAAPQPGGAAPETA
jgi:hypothetical protein